MVMSELGGRYVPDFIHDIPQGPSGQAQADLLLAELRAALVEARRFLHSGVLIGPRKTPLRSEDAMSRIDALLERTKP